MNNHDDIPAELKRQIFKRLSEKYKRCLWPFEECKRKPSNAHSIQNAHTMDLLQRDGHVIMPREDFKLDSGPNIIFKSVSRHRASTFTGLCNYHDSEFFRPIDKETIDLKNKEHLFLIMYRSVIKEYHATLDNSQSLMTSIIDAEKHGFIESNEESPAIQFATGKLIDSYETFLYWSKLNNIFFESNYSEIKHLVLCLPSTRPCLAVSSLFPLELQRRKVEAPPFLIINIQPEANGTHTAIFSYLAEHISWANSILPRFTHATGDHLLYEISKLILEKCENLVISPNIFDGFSINKKNTLLKFFSGNISSLGFRLEMDSPELMLFE